MAPGTPEWRAAFIAEAWMIVHKRNQPAWRAVDFLNLCGVRVTLDQFLAAEPGRA